MKIRNYTRLLTLLLTLLLVACTSDSEPGNNTPGVDGKETAEVTFQLSGTRGVQQPAIDDDDLISSYLIVVANESTGKIVRVISAPTLPPAEMHAVRARISEGSYRVYAFANIPFVSSGDWLYGKFAEGASMPDMSTLYYGDASYGNGYQGPIPMSNSRQGQHLTVVPSKGNQTYGIEVVRMIARVEFVFMNSSSQAIEVQEIGMGPLTAPVPGMTEGYIPLSWYDDSQALSFYETSSLHCQEQYYTHTLGTPISLSAGDMGDGKSNVARFHVIESNPDPVTGQFQLRFRVRYDGKAEDRWALLDKTLVTPEGTNLDGDDDRSPFIRRNDWLRIPLDLGDWELRLEVTSYPPIGGYPEAEIEEESDEKEFRVNFKSLGEFSIRPSVRKFGTTDWKYLDDTSVIESYTFTVDTTSPGMTNIFSQEPTKTGSEILGYISGTAQGTSLVTLIVNIKLGSGVTRKLTRKLYISF